jgi:DNA-binding CsgD family transcriptional regulator
MGRAAGDPGASEIVASTRDPAFATDAGGTILAWNAAAHRLLGFEAPDLIGERCYDRLAGRDVFGNRYCHPDCPLLGMARRHEAIGHTEVHLRSASGGLVPARVNVIVVPMDGSASQTSVIHVLSPVARERDEAVAPREPATPNDRLDRLTPRESEILDLLAAGRSTRDIAAELFISLATARNHIQNILRKLRVHSRLEAVSEVWNGGSDRYEPAGGAMTHPMATSGPSASRG